MDGENDVMDAENNVMDGENNVMDGENDVMDGENKGLYRTFQHIHNSSFMNNSIIILHLSIIIFAS